jgi:hypothetical protein
VGAVAVVQLFAGIQGHETGVAAVAIVWGAENSPPETGVAAQAYVGALRGRSAFRQNPPRETGVAEVTTVDALQKDQTK